VQYIPVQVPGGGIGFNKQVLITQYSVLAHGTPLHCRDVNNVCFFDEMHKDDVQMFRDKLKHIMEEETKQAARAVGLVVPGDEPPTRGAGRRFA